MKILSTVLALAALFFSGCSVLAKPAPRTNYFMLGGAEDKFKEINAAYEILSDEKKRAQYDRHGDAMFGGQNFHDFASSSGMGNLDEILKNIFGGGGFSGFSSRSGFSGFRQETIRGNVCQHTARRR